MTGCCIRSRDIFLTFAVRLSVLMTVHRLSGLACQPLGALFRCSFNTRCQWCLLLPTCGNGGNFRITILVLPVALIWRSPQALRYRAMMATFSRVPALILIARCMTPGNGQGRIGRNQLVEMIVETPIRSVRQSGVDHLLQITT